MKSSHVPFCVVFTMCTSVQDNVVNHIALVFGVIEAERAAQVFKDVIRCTVVVSCLHMHVEGIPEIETEKKGSLNC